jgi:hypothetical protein
MHLLFIVCPPLVQLLPRHTRPSAAVDARLAKISARASRGSYMALFGDRFDAHDLIKGILRTSGSAPRRALARACNNA